MKLLPFLHEFGSDLTIVAKLRRCQLLRDTLLCIGCGTNMREQQINKSDGLRFECSKRSCRRHKSIRDGSFFEGAKLSLCDCMLMIHLWCKNYSEQLILSEYDFAKQTVIDWMRFMRDLCVFHFEHDDAMIGGPDKIVEIDETLVVKRKSNRGRVLETAGWLFGGIERTTNGEFKCFVRLVYNRSASHLTHLIQQHVLPGTHIISDGWGAYVGLSDLGYRHSVVIHEENFVSPDDQSVHTQQIESTWCSLKRFLRSRGTNKGPHLLEYICEWIYRRKFHDDMFASILETLRLKYPL